MRSAETCPSVTASRHRVTDRSTLPIAPSQEPSRARASVCRLNDEKVVNPPQMPTITKVRRFGLAEAGPRAGLVYRKSRLRSCPGR